MDAPDAEEVLCLGAITRARVIAAAIEDGVASRGVARRAGQTDASGVSRLYARILR